MVAIAAAVLVAFIGGLYFITHHKKKSPKRCKARVTYNGLPPKPEERWRYIKELESRQPGVRAPTEPSAGGEVMNPEQLTSEQRQLLAQMQADMRQQPTQLNEVPWNEQTPEQRQQTLQRQRQAQQQVQQQQWANTQPAQQPRTQPRVTEQPYQQQQQQPRTAQTAPAQQPRQTQQPKQTTSQQPYQDLLQTPAHTTTSQPKTQQAAPIAREPEAPKQTAEKKMNVAGWCNAAPSKAPSKRKPCAPSWLLKALTPKSPPTTGGIVWSSALSKAKRMQTAPLTA